jgi:hypothetical protein
VFLPWDNFSKTFPGLVWMNPDSLVFHFEDDVFPVVPKAHPDRLPRRREFYGVAEEVGQRPSQGVRVRPESWDFAGDFETDVRPRHDLSVLKALDLFRGDPDNIRFAEVILLFPLFDLRKIQQIVHQPRQLVRVLGDDREVPVHFPGIPDFPVDKPFHEGLDRGQGRLEFMGDGGDEVRLDLEDLHLVGDGPGDEKRPEGEDDDQGQDRPEVEIPPDVEAFQALRLGLVDIDSPGREIVLEVFRDQRERRRSVSFFRERPAGEIGKDKLRAVIQLNVSDGFAQNPLQ